MVAKVNTAAGLSAPDGMEPAMFKRNGQIERDTARRGALCPESFGIVLDGLSGTLPDLRQLARALTGIVGHEPRFPSAA
jgi:hypothetical protein